MGKMNLSGIFHGYCRTLRNASTGKMGKRDIAMQLCLPALAGVLAFTLWPIDDAAVESVASNVVTGVSIASSLMCGVAVMIFQLRVQLAAQDGIVPDKREVRLVDETYSDVLWAVVVGFASVVLVIASHVFKEAAPILWRAVLSLAFCLVLNLAMVSCMILKRLNASYEIVSKVWGIARR